MTGVSVDIGTSFVKPGGKAGDVLTATATVTGIGKPHVSAFYRCEMKLSGHLGKSLAYTRVDFYNAAGQLAAYGRTSACS